MTDINKHVFPVTEYHIWLYRMGMIDALMTLGADKGDIIDIKWCAEGGPWFAPSGYKRGLLPGTLNMFCAGHKTGKTIFQ